MFIVEKPYASELLIDTVIQHDWFILDNDAIQSSNIELDAFEFMETEQAKEYYSYQEYPLIYSNSENAISWVLDNLPKSNLSDYIRLFKDKAAFRELLKELYPEFFYRKVTLDDIKRIKAKDILFPIVIKPTIGFLSFGVHTVKNFDEWNSVASALTKEMKEAENLYPKNVVNSSQFIIEELIAGDEFAVDAYYDRNGEPVILNIFQHPFLNESDVRDRIYLMSKNIMKNYLEKFTSLLCDIGKLKDIRNFPMHIELRVTEDNKIIPIEVNPMRFAGWCTTDVAKYAWGINVYEYFYNQKKPDWERILSQSDNRIYYFSMAEVPINISRDKIKNFDYKKYLSNFSNIFEVRRIKFQENPLFAIIFGYLTDINEVSRILKLNTNDYIIQ